MSNNKVEEVFFVGSHNIDEYAYYHSLSDEDQNNLEKICVVDSSPSYKGTRFRPDGSDGLEWGLPVEGDYMPKRVKKNGPRREVPDFVKCFGMALVSEKFRQVVEGLESNTHQFLPVEVYWGEGNPVEGKYYWFVVCNALDSINREHTDAPSIDEKFGFKFMQQREGYPFWRIDREGGGKYKMVFDLQVINGHHIWRDIFLVEGPYCSEKFKRACEAANIVGIGFGGTNLVAM